MEQNVFTTPGALLEFMNETDLPLQELTQRATAARKTFDVLERYGLIHTTNPSVATALLGAAIGTLVYNNISEDDLCEVVDQFITGLYDQQREDQFWGAIEHVWRED